MPKQSLAQPAHQPTTEELEHVSGIATRILRGQRLFRDHAERFIYKRGTWLVPSENGIGYYEVRLGSVETCECADYEHRGGPCKHIVAASMAAAKSAVCSCCGHRVLNRRLTEVEDWHDLLGWFVGDLVCPDCIRAGYWS